MAKPLHGILDTYNSATLKEMASFHGISVPGQQSKRQFIERLSIIFVNPERIKRLMVELSPAEQEVVFVLLRNGGTARRQAVERALAIRGLLERSISTSRTGGQSKPRLKVKNSRQLDEILASLLVSGLVFGVLAGSRRMEMGGLLDFSLVEEYFIPDEIRRYLPAPPPEPQPEPLKSANTVRVIPGSARTFQRDIFLYWSFVQSNRLELTGKGTLAKRDLKALNQSLLVREEIGAGVNESHFKRLVFLRAMLTHLGLIGEAPPGRLTAAPDPAFLKQEPAKRVQASFEAYVSGGFTNELSWAPQVRLNSQSIPRLPTPPLVTDARRLVLLYLKQSSGWTSLPSLVQRLYNQDYEFLFSRSYQDPSVRHYYYSSPNHPYTIYTNPLNWDFEGIRNNEDGWWKVEGVFIRDILQGPLFWMGLVDLGFTTEDSQNPDAFRLTPVGEWLMGKGPPPEIPAKGGQVIVQPNFQVMAFDPVSDSVLMNLNRFCERVSTERVAEFRITRASVYAAQRQGWDASRIRAYLEEQSKAPLPENISKTLDEWQALHERITIRPGLCLMHAAAREDLDALQAIPAVRKLLGMRFAPTLVQVRRPDRIPEVTRTLHAHEQLPLVRQASQLMGGALDDLPPRSVSINAAGELRFMVGAPDLYLHGHLRRFAIPDGPGYRLTPEAVRRAAQGGLGAPQILDALKRVLNSPVPEKLAQRIRAWSGHYGEAVLEDVTLLHLEDEKIFEELRQDPEIGPLLHPYRPRRVQALARIRARDLPRLRALLEERGVTLKDNLTG